MTAKKKAATGKPPAQNKNTGSGKGGLTKIGALWLKTGANGKFMSGTMNLDESNPNGMVKVLVFKNNYKEEDRHPDYVVYVPNEELDRTKGPITDKDLPF